MSSGPVVPAPVSQSQAAPKMMTSVPVEPYGSSNATVPATVGSQPKATETMSQPPAASTYKSTATKVGSGMGLVMVLGAGLLML